MSCILYQLLVSTLLFMSLEGCACIVERYVDTVSCRGNLSRGGLCFLVVCSNLYL